MLLRVSGTWLLLLAAFPAWGQSTPMHVDVYVSGTGGYFAYRIPAIETAPDGSLLALAEARNTRWTTQGSANKTLTWSCDGAPTWAGPGPR